MSDSRGEVPEVADGVLVRFTRYWPVPVPVVAET